MTAHTPAHAIIVVNPNSTRSATQGMDRALDDLRQPDGPAIRRIRRYTGRRPAKPT